VLTDAVHVQIDDLNEVAHLAACEHLQILSLEYNPVTQMPHYRAHIIRFLPQVKLLDNKEITPVERQQAEITVKREEKVMDLMFSNEMLIEKLHKVRHARARTCCGGARAPAHDFSLARARRRSSRCACTPSCARSCSGASRSSTARRLRRQSTSTRAVSCRSGALTSPPRATGAACPRACATTCARRTHGTTRRTPSARRPRRARGALPRMRVRTRACSHTCVSSVARARSTELWDQAFSVVMTQQQTRIAELLSAVDTERQRALESAQRARAHDPHNTASLLREQENEIQDRRTRERDALINDLRSTIRRLDEEYRLSGVNPAQSSDYQRKMRRLQTQLERVTAGDTDFAGNASTFLQPVPPPRAGSFVAPSPVNTPARSRSAGHQRPGPLPSASQQIYQQQQQQQRARSQSPAAHAHQQQQQQQQHAGGLGYARCARATRRFSRARAPFVAQRADASV
jgi:hypothetical protein